MWKMLTIGRGPGPKNVLAVNEKGEHTVFTYRNWKKIKEEQMADGDLYGTVVGFVQFDVETRQLDQGDVRDVTVRSVASGENWRITLWPDFSELEVERGDFLAVDGKITFREHNGKTYNNMNARRVFVGQQFKPAEREVVKKEGKKTF